MKELAATMTADTSTLFVLVRKSTPDKVLEELKGTGGRILKTSLSNEDEAKVQTALTAVGSSQGPSGLSQAAPLKMSGYSLSFGRIMGLF